MRQLLKVLKCFLLLCLFLNLGIWMMIQGSSHRIPLQTALKFGIICFVLIALWVKVICMIRRKK